MTSIDGIFHHFWQCDALSTCPEKKMSFINISMMRGFTDWPGGSNTPWFQSGEGPK